MALALGLLAMPVRPRGARAQPVGPQVAPPPGALAEPSPPASATPKPGTVPTAPASPRQEPAPAPTAGAPAQAGGSSAAPAVTNLSLAEALRNALSRHPSIANARTQLAAAQADLLGSRAPFDATLDASLGHTHDVFPAAPGLKSTTDTTSLGVGATKVFGWGTRLSPRVGIDRIHQRQQPGFGAPAQDPVQRARADLFVIQPLLRGAGSDGASSLVRSGEHGLRAAEHSVAHTAQLQAFDAVVAYWQLVAAQQELALAQESRARAQKLVDDTRLLVEADQRPRGDLRQLEGNLATRVRGVIDAENARLQRLHSLRLSMGLELEEGGNWEASDALPAGGAVAASMTQLTELALQHRQDLQSAREQVQAGEAAYAGADHNTLPQLDLSVSVGYAGAAFDDGVGPFFQSTADHIEGVNAGATLSLELPLSNRAQEAERGRASAQLESARIGEQDLRRTTKTQVAAALDDLRLSAEALGAAQQAESHYAHARNDERDKLRAGLSTVIDVVLMEDRLIQAQLDRLRTQVSYALALARLRLELGQLPSDAQELGPALAGLTDAGVR